jgi:hypothetical protein
MIVAVSRLTWPDANITFGLILALVHMNAFD